MDRKIFRTGRLFVMAALLIGLTAGLAAAGDATLDLPGDITGSVGTGDAAGAVDYQNAKPMPLPTVDKAPPDIFEEDSFVEYPGAPGSEPGFKGTGKMTPEIWAPALPLPGVSGDAAVEPSEYGTSKHPFNTSRVDVLGTSNAVSKLYPFRATGKLYFTTPDGTFVCSASLIKKGIIVTAAHCVANFGHSQFYSNWQYVPALWGVTRPYGTWTTVARYIKTAYYNGTDICAPGATGVVCRNDVAILVATPQSGVYPGTSTGYYSYGYNGAGFVTPATGPKITLINQLGYPVSHDSGLKMQRTDSQGFFSTTMANNTVWGSRQTGGSSGGPELVNLGARATLGGGVTLGSAATLNMVVGVTSWGYTDQTIKQQGASPFLSTNIGPSTVAGNLVSAACTAYPAACAP